uniref:ATP-dependent DNA helicase n=1 Tax=Octopus bimaculoides TaxID=37653 RepID=A0A0L8FXN2_OCTBM
MMLLASNTGGNSSGTGKTFVINLLLVKIRQMKDCVIASSGIVTTLLNGGRTAHSFFKFPLDLSKKEKATCNISRGTIEDEATMSDKGVFEALDRALQDLRHNIRLMESAIVLLVGDFRQTLPVIPKGTRADKKLRLKTNTRVQLSGDEEAVTFYRKLLDVGKSTLAGGQGVQVSLHFGHIVLDIQEPMARAFPNLGCQFKYQTWLRTCAILVPNNVTVGDLNIKLLDQLPGERCSLKSIDSDEVVNYLTEFLNSLSPAGFPPHNLHLKIGLCNGTRLTMKKMMLKLLETTIPTSKASGSVVFIPRILLIPPDMPFEFNFAMIIKKLQGECLDVVGLNLAEPVFFPMTNCM